MKRVVTTLAILTLSAGALADERSPAPPAPPKLELVVHAAGFKHARGHAIARLFGPGDSVMGPGRASVKADIHGNEVTISFPGLTAGPYAVLVFHDENDNGTLDHGVFGPAEPLGFSNAVGHSFGPPSFEQVKFLLTPKNTRIEIALR
jgi:uncharacterized protein (DUF2141 family)